MVIINFQLNIVSFYILLETRKDNDFSTVYSFIKWTFCVDLFLWWINIIYIKWSRRYGIWSVTRRVLSTWYLLLAISSLVDTILCYTDWNNQRMKQTKATVSHIDARFRHETVSGNHISELTLQYYLNQTEWCKVKLLV